MAKEKEEVVKLKTAAKALKERLGLADKQVELLQAEIARLKTEKFSMEGNNNLLLKENNNLKKRNEKLEEEKGILHQQVQRPKMSPENLMSSLKDAIVGMEEGLKSEKTRFDYTLNKFDVDLRTNVYIDKENKLFIHMPFIGETIPSENLSVMKFSLSSAPKARIPLITVPNVIGRTKDLAITVIENAGLKALITEKSSPNHRGMVIDQDPEAYSEVPSETEVVIVIAKSEAVKVPNLIGMEKDTAVKTLKSNELMVGKVEDIISDAEPGIIVRQSPRADSAVEIESPVDIVISVKGIKVPDLIGKKEEEVRELIKKSNLSVGRVSYAESLFHDSILKQDPVADEIVPQQSPIAIKIGKRISPEKLKQLIFSFPEARKIGLTAEPVFHILDTFGFNNMKLLEEFIVVPDKTIKEKMKLGNLKMVKYIKKMLKEIEKKLETEHGRLD